MLVSVAGSTGTLFVGNDSTIFAMRGVVGLGLGATIMVANIVAANFPDPDRTFAWLGLINLAFGALAVEASSRFQLYQANATPFHPSFSS